MKGAGPYNDWAYYSSPSSNLSAFAPPFAVNRFNSMDVTPPLANSGESDPVPPVHFAAHSYGYDFFPNPVRELESRPSTEPSELPHFNFNSLKESFAYDQYPNNSVFESQRYYPSYISPPIHHSTLSVAPSLWSSSSVFDTLDGSSIGDNIKNQSVDFNQGLSKRLEGGSGLYSMRSVIEESMMNQGCQDVKDSNSGESLHMMAGKKHSDDKSCWQETIKSTPETHHETPLKFVAHSGNHHSSFTGSFEKHLRQHDQPSWVDTVSSTPKTGLIEDLNVGNIASDRVFGSNIFNDMNEVINVPSSRTATAGCFDLGQLHVHLSHEPTSLNNTLISDNNVPNDVVDYIFKDRSGIQNLHAIQDNLSLRLSANEGFNSVEKSFDSADRYNPAVDSPCWKGVPAAHFSDYEAFEAMPPGYLHKNEECFGSIIQGSQKFILDTGNNVKKSSEISNSYHKESDCQEQSFKGSSSYFSVTKIASEDCDSDGAVNAGQSQSELSVPPTKPIYDCETRSSYSEGQGIEENKLISQKQHIVCDGGPGAGCNVNGCLEYGASPAAKGDLSSPALVVDSPTTVEKSAEKVSTQKLNVQILVDTMHNLSELLLCHCMNDSCEVKEQECNVLRKVISNLSTCALKNADQTTPAQDCLLPQPETSRFSGESCKLHKNASFERPQLTTIGPESSEAELENHLVQEAKNLPFRSGKPHWSFSDSFAPRVDAEIKEDNMTKALKGILSENFHDEEGAESQTILYKNLWLEAEAALCSIYYKARYNQMKIDMKFAFDQKDNALDMEEQSKPKFAPSLSTSESPVTKVQSGPTPDSSALDILVSSATNPKEVSSLKFSTDLNKPDAGTHEGKGSHELDISIQNSTVSKTNKEAGDDEASVKARFNVLKARFDKSCITTVLEELSNKEDKLASNGRDHHTHVDPPILGKKKPSDYEASVMARFHILKSRAEDSSFISSEGQPLDGGGFDGKGIDFSVKKDASEDESMNAFFNLSSYPTIDKSRTKEFNVDLEDNQEEFQPSRTYRFGNYGNHLRTYYSDGLASDWEHIEKKTL